MQKGEHFCCSRALKDTSELRTKTLLLALSPNPLLQVGDLLFILLQFQVRLEGFSYYCRRKSDEGADTNLMIQFFSLYLVGTCEQVITIRIIKRCPNSQPAKASSHQALMLGFIFIVAERSSWWFERRHSKHIAQPTTNRFCRLMRL